MSDYACHFFRYGRCFARAGVNRMASGQWTWMCIYFYLRSRCVCHHWGRGENSWWIVNNAVVTLISHFPRLELYGNWNQSWPPIFLSRFSSSLFFSPKVTLCGSVLCTLATFSRTRRACVYAVVIDGLDPWCVDRVVSKRRVGNKVSACWGTFVFNSRLD